MDSSDPATPPSDRSEPRLRPKSASRLAHSFKDPMDPSTIKSPLRGPIPLQDLLLLSPSSSQPPTPHTVVNDCLEPASGIVPRKKNKTPSHLPMSCASPRSTRRARRIIREERDLASSIDDDLVKLRKRRQSTKPRASRKEKLPLVSPPLPPTSPVPKIVDEDNCSSMDDLLERISELILWKNVAKSTLWFGFGSMFFLSSWFSRDVCFSFISAISHLSFLVLAMAFFCNSFSQCKQKNWRRDIKLTEEDVLCVSRVVLPFANAALAKAQGIFSGEPLMTLKVVPVLLFGAKFGHLITPWRLFAIGFFLIFTVPKLYSCYSHQIHKRVESIRNYIWEAWSSCQHKKLAGGSAAILLWNLFSVKARIFAAFISMVLLRYHHQQPFIVEDVEKELQEGELQQELITAE